MMSLGRSNMFPDYYIFLLLTLDYVHNLNKLNYLLSYHLLFNKKSAKQNPKKNIYR